MLGIIVKIISNNYTIKHNDDYFECKARGRFRNDNITPLVGDKVIFDQDMKLILDILPRDNQLIRPSVSNINQALIVMSVKEPDFDFYMLDKLLLIISFNQIKPIICLTKMDLLTFKEKRKVKKYRRYYQKIGYLVFTNQQIRKLKTIFKDKITVLTGPSGVGKSTLLNKLDVNLKLQTGVISKALKKGKHTTRHVELFSLYEGLIADTPGFTSLELTNMTKEDVRNNMIEFDKYKDQCRYRNCFHLKGSNCQIREMVNKGQILESRYQNYQKFIKEIEEIKKW
jgi:ribosome biogenesis GTPase